MLQLLVANTCFAREFGWHIDLRILLLVRRGRVCSDCSQTTIGDQQFLDCSHSAPPRSNVARQLVNCSFMAALTPPILYRPDNLLILNSMISSTHLFKEMCINWASVAPVYQMQVYPHSGVVLEFPVEGGGVGGAKYWRKLRFVKFVCEHKRIGMNRNRPMNMCLTASYTSNLHVKLFQAEHWGGWRGPDHLLQKRRAVGGAFSRSVLIFNETSTSNSRWLLNKISQHSYISV